jgi:predicted DNA-binding transcriptional regulator YafY
MMDAEGWRIIREAIAEQRMVTIEYANESRGAVTVRHVRPYELSFSRSGRPTLWGTDSIHGPRRIHAFRQDRILSVKPGRKAFEKAKSITKHLKFEGRAEDEEWWMEEG